MKYILLAISLGFLFGNLAAQAPDKFSYQAVIRDASGAVKVNETVNIQVEILQGTISSTPLYLETQSKTTNEFGIVNLIIGESQPIPSGIDWSQGPFYLKVWVNGAEMGTCQLLTVPYAMYANYAKEAGNSFSGDYNDLANKPALANVATSGSYSDLTNTPSLFDGSWTSLTDKPNLALVAVSGNYNDLSGKPELFSGSYDSLTDKPSLFDGTWTSITDKPNLSIVAISGNYEDLINKPTLWDSSYFSLKERPVSISDLSLNANNLKIINLANPIDSSDAATKAYVDALLARIEALEKNDRLYKGCFTDSRDGNHYTITKIGDQLWMAENLRYLPTVNSPDSGSDTIPCYYVYDYNGTSLIQAKATINYSTYGVLYNWPAAMAGSLSSISNPSMVQGICPTGWHLPSFNEWMQLTNYLDNRKAGGKLREAGLTHWKSPNTLALNETGFTALPGGLKDGSGNFTGINEYTYFQTTTEKENVYAFCGLLFYYGVGSGSGTYHKSVGFSVRCIKD
jgi:uncharacterized protein (TIGR02145 family)